MTARSLTIAALLTCMAGVAHAQTPGPPSNLTATIDSSNNANFAWNAPTTGGVPTGYLVQIGTAPGLSDALNQQIGNVTTFQVVNGTLPPATYYVRVRALNGSGISGPSNEILYIVTCAAPSQAATSVTWRATTTAAQITWVGVPGGGQYRVDVGTTPGGANVASVATPSGSNQNFLSVALPGAGTYFARVRALRTCGSPPSVLEGPASEEVTIIAAALTPSTTVVVNEFNTFVELKNISTGTLNISGYRIQGSSGANQLVARLATVPAGVSIAPGCTYLLAATGDTLLGATTRDLALSEAVTEGVAVIQPGGMIVDAAGRRSNFSPTGPDTPYLETTGLPKIADSAGVQSFARAGDLDTNNNAADFVPLATATPQNAAACFASQAPGAPQNLTAIVSGSTVTLSWSAPTTGGAVTVYRLEAGTAPGASNAGVFDLSGGVTSVAFTGVTNATFYVRVRAVNSFGVSAASNEVTVVVCGLGCTGPPGAVTQLAFNVSGRNVLLTWRAPTTGPSPTGYVIDAGTGPGLTNIGQFPTGSTAEFVTVTNVPPGTYFVRVRAVVGSTLGAPSNEVVIVVQ